MGVVEVTITICVEEDADDIEISHTFMPYWNDYVAMHICLENDLTHAEHSMKVVVREPQGPSGGD